MSGLWNNNFIFSPFRLFILGGGNSAINAQIEDLSNQLMESKLTIEGLEKERDF